MNKLFFLFILFLSSCSYHIYIEKNGTATVTVRESMSDDNGNQVDIPGAMSEIFDLYDSLSSNPAIYNYKRIKNEISYSVVTDSLGKYLFPFDENTVDSKLKFNQYKDSLVITEFFHGLESGEFEAYMELSEIKMQIEFDRTIKSFQSDFKNVKKINRKKLELLISDREFSYGKGMKKIIVTF